MSNEISVIVFALQFVSQSPVWFDSAGEMTCERATRASFKSLLENLPKLTEVFWFTWQRVLQLKSSHIYYYNCHYCFVMLAWVNIHWENRTARSIAHRPNSCGKGLVCLCVSAIEAAFFFFSHTSKCVWCWRNAQTTVPEEFLLFLRPANTRRHDTICTSRCFKRRQLAGAVITNG